jgi:hypothetical protein
MKKYLYAFLKIFVPGIFLLAAILGILYGPGLLDQPKVRVVAASFDMKIPEQIQSDYFFFRMLFLNLEMVKVTLAGLEDNLRRLGFPKKKLALLRPAIEEVIQGKRLWPIKSQDLTKKLDLAPNEERMLYAALMNMRNFSKASTAFLPSNVLLFRVTNSGKKDAEDFHVTIRMAGAYMDSEIKSDNQILSTRQVDPNCIEVTSDKLSPDSNIGGRVWYDSFAYRSPDKNKIVAIYKNGRKEIEFSEGGLEGLMLR